MSVGKRRILNQVDRAAPEVPAAPPEPATIIRQLGRQVVRSCIVMPLQCEREAVVDALRAYGIEVVPWGILFLVRGSPSQARDALGRAGIVARIADEITTNKAA